MKRISSKGRKFACICIDLESDYGFSYINTYEAFQDTTQLELIMKKHNVIPTVFITKGVMEGEFPFVEKLKRLGAEFELHIVTHSPIEARIAEIREAKVVYKRRFGHQPLGYRGPAGIVTEEELRLLAAEGFKFDSSIFGFRRPGFIDHSMMPIRPFYYPDFELMEIPPSVIPVVRLPLSMAYIQLLMPTYKLLIKVFGLTDIVLLHLHLHDLFPSEAIERLPLGLRMSYRWNYLINPLKTLEDYIIYLKRQGYRFVSMYEIYGLVKEGVIKTETLTRKVWEQWKSRN
jgi:peptidoglycan/xylan/chitin deacetylase (PgdA/CDA1 family)